MDEINEQTHRRATADEIAAARAWIEQTCGNWPELDRHGIELRPAEYERALAVIVFANDRAVSRG